MKRMFLGVVIAIGLAAIVVLLHQRLRQDRSLPNVIVISVDTLRPDHLGSYGYSLPTSPTIDSLLAEGVRFEKVVCQMPSTAPSFCSIMTGAYPHTHGSLQNGMPLVHEVMTLPEGLKREGYHTAAFVSSYTVSDESSGLARGFALFDDDFEGEERPAEETTDRLVAHLDHLPGGPLFLWVHYFEPHGPYVEHPDSRIDPPSTVSSGVVNTMDDPVVKIPGWVQRELGLAYYVRLYDGEIAHADDQIRRLLEELARRGLMEGALIVFLADHGESFEHGLYCRHGLFLYESSVRIPLGMIIPGDEFKGMTIPYLVQSIDVAPTICDVLGLPPPEDSEGRSLMPRIRGEQGTPEVAFLERRRYEEENRFGVKGNQYAIRTEEWKYVHSSEAEDELYHLINDPGELRNLIDVEPDKAEELRSRLIPWIQEAGILPEGMPHISDEAREKLEALGYIQ